MKGTILLLMLIAIVLSAFPVQPVAAQGTTYTVQPGDNLFRIALRFGTTVEAIQAANGLRTTVILVGQVLVIPGAGGVPDPAPAPGVAATPTSALGAGGTYTVQAGDNLYRISLRFKTTVAAIQAANGLTTTVIRVGQVLTIPGAGGPPPPTTGGSAGGTTPVPTATPVVVLGAGGTYTVQAGDNLYRLALRFKTTVAAIQAANGLNTTNIRVGQVLVIPGAAGAPAPTATRVPATAAPGSTPAPTAAPPTPSASGAAFELGGQVATFARPDLMTFSGMKWVKWQVVWRPGDSASAHTWLVGDAHGKGFKVLLSVKGSPSDTTADKFPAFATFAGDLAAAGADAIEVWNETNIDREWRAGHISPAAYVPMLQQAYNAIKAKNPNTMVISGAPAPTGFYGGCSGVGCDDKPYMEGMFAAGAANYMDCIGIHYNEGLVSPTQSSGDPRGNPNHYTRYYQTMVDTYYNAGGGKKKLCFTELGYLSGQEWGFLPAGFLWKPPYNLTVAQHAQYLAEATRLSRDQGKVRMLIVFNVDFTTFTDDPQAAYAILRPGGSCPACDTLRAVMSP